MKLIAQKIVSYTRCPKTGQVTKRHLKEIANTLCSCNAGKVSNTAQYVLEAYMTDKLL